MAPTQRKASILDFDPNTYEYRWYEVRYWDLFGKVTERIRQIALRLRTDPATDHREDIWFCTTMLLPYLNLEALANDPENFLMLLANQSKYLPEASAPYDSFVLEKPWGYGNLEFAYNPNCVHMEGNQYGKLTPWDQDKAHEWRIVGYPRARKILWAKRRVLSFLRHIVENNIITSAIGDDRSNKLWALTQDQSGNIKGKKTSTYSVSTFLHLPYSAPPKFNIAEFKSIAMTRLNFNSDHLQNLQTEPQYLRRYAELFVAEAAKE